VVIELTDGSVVVVHPNSRIVISNYRAAASMREMFRILIGRVRVKVAHYGGKPNPYRVNSPTASILVRGTEFVVAVESSGDTRVEVYEGLVEVQSLSDPSGRVYLSAKQGALVKANEEIRLYTPASGDRNDERGGKNDDADGDNAGKNDDADGDNAGRNGDADGDNAGLNANPKAKAGLNAKTNGNASVNPNANAGVSGAANDNAAPNANANVRGNPNAKAGLDAKTNGNADTNDNAGLNAKTKDNAGVDAKTKDNVAPKDNAGVNAKTKDNAGANAKTKDNAGISVATNANANANANARANPNAKAGLDAKTNGNADTNDNAGLNAKTKDNTGLGAKTKDNVAPKDNAGVNAKTKDNAGANAKTKDNAGVNAKTNDSAAPKAKTNDNAGVNAKTNDNAGVNAKTNDNAAPKDNAGVNAKTNDNAVANAKTNDNAGVNAKTNNSIAPNDNAGVNAKTNDNAGARSKRNANAGVNAKANDNAGARANPNDIAKRNDAGGGGGAAGKSVAFRPVDGSEGGLMESEKETSGEAAGKLATLRLVDSSDNGLMEREKETSGEAVGKSAALPTGDNNPTRDDVAANATTGVRTYLTNDFERYVDSLAGRGWSISLQRFSAFADSHFDSLDNPAYSTEFASIEGRAWLIPFFNKSRGGDLQSGSTGFPLSGNLISPFDSGLLSQVDFFIPLEKVRMVIGGAIAISSDRSQSLAEDQAPASLIRLLPGGGQVSRYVAVSTETTSITGSLVAARRFGDDGRTSVGVGVEWVSDGDGMRGQISLANGARARAIEELEADSQISRLRLRLGMTREFDGGHKLGVVYTHELASADDRDRSRLLAGGLLSVDSTRQEGRSSEVSFRLRGPLTRRLFYGLVGSLLWGESDGQIRRSVITDSTTRADVNSAAAGFGVGFALRRATVLSADFAFGLSRLHEGRREDATGNPVEDRRDRERFVSGRLGLQTDVWRRLFFSSSALFVGQAATVDLDLRPDLFGRRLTSLGLVELSGRSRRNSTSVFSNFGAGWRFNRNLLAEYIFSINSGLGPTRHVFLLRYTFKREE
jgi:hypothetical protein